MSLDRFNPNVFDVQGIVPVGYALFAVVLGLAAGTIVRRTLPALAITLGVFVVSARRDRGMSCGRTTCTH